MSKCLLNRSPFLIVLGLLLYKTTFAQSGDVNFTSITSRSGLSSNSVNAIIKDKHSLMWFGTDDGLNKYDGTNFTVYRHRSNDSTSLPSNDVTALFEDKQGNLWIGTNGGSVSIYNRKQDCFINFLSGRSNQIHSYIRTIRQDSFGKIWIAHVGGISIIVPKYDDLLRSKISRKISFKPRSQVALCLFEDSRNRMWIGTNEGLLLHQENRPVLKVFKQEVSNPKSVTGNVIKSITEDVYHNLWVGTSDGLSMLLPGGKDFISYRSATSGLTNDIICTLAPTKDGKLWIGTEGGLNILDIKTQKFSRFFPDSRNNNSLTSKSIRFIYIDKEGIYWLGTYQGGINKYDKNLSIFHLKQSNLFDKNGLKAPVVTAFAKGSSDNNVYVGTDGGGLHLFDKKTGLFNHVAIRSGQQSLNNLSILAMEKSRANELWIGTYATGLFKYDPLTGASRQFKMGAGADDLGGKDVFCLKEDQHGNIWIGTNGNGVNVYHPMTKKISRYHKNNVAVHSRLPLNGFIRAIEEDDDGAIWIGSYGSGLAVFNPTTQEFKVFNKYNSNLPTDAVLSLLADQSGNIWVGTMGGGLSLFNKQKRSFTSFSEEQGLANSVVYKIIEDAAGLIWCSTNRGISSFNVRTHAIKNYTHHNGIQNNNFVLGSGLLTDDNTLFFGGLEGFNYFNPSSLKTNEHVPPVILTDLKIANKSVTPSKDAALKEHIAIAREIELEYKQSFSISFVALNYTTPQQNKYSYKLAGFDKDWNFEGSAKTASYTNLSPGTYVFKVRASNNDGIWNNNGTSIIIHVNPPYWLTGYAYFLYVLLFSGSLLYLRYQGIKKLKKKFAIEREKIEIKQQIEQEHQEVARIHELDRLKIKFLTNLSHEFRTPISLIMGTVDNFLANPKKEGAYGQIHMVKRNARRLLNLVNQLLDFRKMEEHELKLHLKPGEIVSYIKEVTESFKDYSERKRIDLRFETKIPYLHTSFDHDKIERIFFNLLSNAFKFTFEGASITVIIERLPDEKGDCNSETVLLSVRVVDTGIGIQENQKDKIFDRFFQDDAAAAVLNQGTGIGLSITKEFVKMHGGEISVESEIGKGSAFLITLPFKNESDQRNELVSSADPGFPEVFLEQVSNEKPGAQHRFPKEKPSILLVEDNEDFRFYIKDNLKADYHVLEAGNGKEGWQIALAQHPHLIVSDITMPEMDGIQLSRKIKGDKRTNQIPVILLTALSSEEEQIKGLSTGANDYITKPFSFEILNAKIRNLLDSNQTLKKAYVKQIKVVAPEIEIEPEDEKLMKKVVRYIDQNINNPKLSVEDLSRHVGMSRSSLYHRLLEITGETPVEYIRSIKLDKAAVLLEKSNLNVAQVAYMVGFATPNYFAKSFKARFDVLPSAFKASKNGTSIEQKN